MIENECPPWQLRGGPSFSQVVIEKRLDALIDGTQTVGQTAIRFALPRQDRLHQPGHHRPFGIGGQRQAE